MRQISTRQKLAIALVLLFTVFTIWWCLRPRPTDEELILELVSKAEYGIETKDREIIMACVAPDYHDEAGLTKADIFRLALQWERAPEQVEITVERYELEVDKPTAIGQFDVFLVFSQDGRQDPPLRLPISARFEKQRRGLRRAWLVTSVSGHGLFDSEEFF